MAPTPNPASQESQILTSFLLHGAPLPSTTTLAQFTALFPSASQSSPEIRRLYRMLQHRRALIIDTVAENIATEVRRGTVLRRAVVRERLRSEGGGQAVEDDEEILVEKALFDSTSSLPTTSRPHTLNTIIPELRSCAETIEGEIETLEAEAAKLLAEIESTVSGLSDLRYGKFENGAVVGDVLTAVEGLEAVCEMKK